MALANYEQDLLTAWEEVHKKGQLTLWTLLALKDSPKHMQQIKEFVVTITNGTLGADDKSMYRALRRYYDAEMIDFKNVPSDNGPDLKVYSLTGIGKRVLDKFIDRNIRSVFYSPKVAKLFNERGKL